jgi:hypothetical protein
LKTFRDFLKRLEVLEWRRDGQLDPDVLEVLAEVGRQPRLVYEVVSAWSLTGLEKRQLSCHETSTHYKWFLHYHERLRYKVWLHQYKSAQDRSAGYAEVPHSHRYSLASVILSGGFRHHYFETNNGTLTEPQGTLRRYGPGDTYAVDWQEVHKLSNIDEHTFTMVVEGPTVRHFSEAYYGTPAGPILFHDFVGLRPRLADEMKLIVAAAEERT